MRLNYRYGWPLSRLVARIGIPTKIVVEVIFDDEAHVFVGTSRDLQGLVVESDSLEGIAKEALSLIPELVCKPSDLGAETYADVRFRDRVVHA